MDESIILGWIILLIETVSAVYLRVFYFKSEALCLGYSTGRASLVSFPTYAYELEDNGVVVKYVNRGTTIGFPKKGKRYKVLIKYNDHNKVVGYAEFVSDVVLSVIAFAIMLVKILIL